MQDISRSLDLIYQAAFIPEQWISVFDDLALAAGAQGASLGNITPTGARWLASPSLADMDKKMLDEGWVSRNTRAEKLMTIPQHGFVDEAEHFTEEDYNTHPIFTEVLKPLGYGFGTSTFIQAPTGDNFIVAVEKKKVTGPVTKQAIAYLDQLRPHLARAALMSSRLEFERITAAVEALQLTGLPSAVFTDGGKMLAANALLEGFSPQIVLTAANQVRFAHEPANQLFATALADMARPGARQDGPAHSFPLPRIHETPPAIVHMIPVRGDARDIFTRATCFLIVTPVDRSRVPSAGLIQGLFDLSPAEARVAWSLAAGNDATATAGQQGVSVETVRSHVKAILQKSGMNRQADFVAAIASIKLPPG
jgi:DNA-binding CsgD family transcriptional regulator